MVDALGDSHYEALQTSLNRRFSHNLQFFFSYTFSKSIDDTSGSYGLDGGGAVYNPTNASADTGISNFDRAHNVRVSVIYRPPFYGAWSFESVYQWVATDRPLHLLVRRSLRGWHHGKPRGQRHVRKRTEPGRRRRLQPLRWFPNDQ
jgi:hypothetical protein